MNHNLNLIAVKNIIVSIKNKGFFDIVFGSFIVKIISFLSVMFLPRFLNVADYGSLTYAETFLTYLLLVNGLGLNQATLRYCVQEKNIEKRQNIFFNTTLIGSAINLIFVLVTYLTLKFVNIGISGSKELLMKLILIPLLTFIFQNIQFYLRANFENKSYSRLSIFYTLLYIGLQIALAIIVGLQGVVIARYLSYMICILVAFSLVRKNLKIKNFKLLSKEYIKKMLLFSSTIMVGDFFSVGIATNESFLIGRIFNDANILAQYKVGSYALSICILLTSSIMVFMMPYFTKNSDDKNWIWNNFTKLYSANIVLMLIIVGVLYIYADVFIISFFGERYISAIPIMRTMLIAAFAQSGLKAIPGMILGFIGEEKYNLMNNLISFFMHIIIEYIILSVFGSKFVGIGLVFSYSYSGIMMYKKLKKVCTIK